MDCRGALFTLILGAAVCPISCATPARETAKAKHRPPHSTPADAESPTTVMRRVPGAAPAIQLASAEETVDSPPDPGAENRKSDPVHSIPGPDETSAADEDSALMENPVLAENSGAVLASAAPEESDHPLPISLATALRLSDARPLVVAAAQASAWVAEAQLQRANVIWVPQFDFGAVYYRHDGFGPDFNRGVNHPGFGFPGGGGPLNQNLNYFYGYGSFYQVVNVTDAIFEPLAARQVMDARRQEIQAAKNDALLATANAYFDVHQYRGQYAGARDVVERGEKLVDRISHLAEDLVPKVEVDRSRWLLAAMEQKAVKAREQWRVSSANLTQVLRLDPSAVVVPVEHDHLQITLIDPARSLEELVAIGVTNRPEIAADKSLIQAAEARIRREKNRPLLPLVLITGFQTPGNMMSQFGIFGTGNGDKLNLWSLREDVSLQLVWQLDGMGFGNLARIKEQRGQESEAIVNYFKMQDKVAAEVTEAQARLQAAAVKVVQAERSMREAIVNYDGNYEGLAQTTRFENVLHQVYRPQEAVKALERVMESYDQYFTTVAEYNRAQFELYHALGYPAQVLADRQLPGDLVPGDTDRPFGLPEVGEGPPPATR
jgi:outer membrane protein TolC